MVKAPGTDHRQERRFAESRMSRRVIRSELALSDLAELAEYIRQQSPGSAVRFLDEAESTLHQLAAMPGIGERFLTENPVFQDLRCCNIYTVKGKSVVLGGAPSGAGNGSRTMKPLRPEKPPPHKSQALA